MVLSGVKTRQRADLTFKHNIMAGRHGWLRLTPAYSVKVVEDILQNCTSSKARVLEPFSGTGTTALSASINGHEAIACDINPFLVWLGNAKLATYSLTDIEQAREQMQCVLKQTYDNAAEAPPIFNIERWWDADKLKFLCSVKGSIDRIESGKSKDLLLIAFCRTMISLSNAAFNHQSMSFKTPKQAAPNTVQVQLFEKSGSEYEDQFVNDVSFVLGGAAHVPQAKASVILQDSRTINTSHGYFDLLITSPPYPNRMSYIRELRPYMYWLGFLKESREAGEMDWLAIGGTWGIATSRVAEWKKQPTTFFPPYLDGLLDKIAHADNKSGHVLSCYVGKYFEDMWLHFTSVLKAMNAGASMHYIVGNSKFYDVLIPAEKVYRDMLLEAGAKSVDIVTLRKRNSKKELIEFDVVAQV
jgi:hypothetical protein